MNIDLTGEQVGLLIIAMYEKQMETKRYLSGFDAPEKPNEHHTCCDFHRLRYERDRELLLSLENRKVTEDELIALLEKYE